MAYFPHAFQKMLAGTHATVPFYDGDGTTGTNGTTTTLSLAAGQIGIVSAKNNVCADLDGTPTYANYPMIYLAQGSFHASDILGSSMHGGYQETVKSKGINPKYVSKFYKVLPANPVNQIIKIEACDCTIECNKTYWLRVDVKGSPALRYLTHNAYFTAEAFSGCCNVDEDPVDPNVLLLQWADAINANVLINPFIQAKVYNDVNALAPITLDATTTQVYVTPSAVTNIVAGQRVVFHTTANSSATTSSIIGHTFTVGTIAAGTIFTVGQTITGTGVTAGTKIVTRVSGDGGTGSVFTVNNSHNLASLTVSSTSNITCFVISSYAGAADVPLVMANDINTPSTTAIATITVAALTVVNFYEEIDTDTYVPATGASDPLEVCGFIELEGAYVGTTFADCSFDPKDFHEKQPVAIYASIVDESGDPCNVYCFEVSEVQASYQGKGFGETLVRELILAKEYQQEPYHCDPRMREVVDQTALSEISRSAQYVQYYILHSIPRNSNPSGTMDNDQYLVKIPVGLAGYGNANTAKFEVWMNTLLTSAGNNVQLEVLA